MTASPASIKDRIEQSKAKDLMIIAVALVFIGLMLDLILSWRA